ncbi:hypothetical protein [Mesorhizobium sp. YM1C-6-2]|uniref:hypothetical protein n=1 Tax=Mesorhizobium sp. YM1C-6-2 TaxID=1827501 RepID=UPI001FE18AEE|nr:hypothetical protein [Mesorhizobium sp. YM1C-6-2]
MASDPIPPGSEGVAVLSVGEAGAGVVVSVWAKAGAAASISVIVVIEAVLNMVISFSSAHDVPEQLSGRSNVPVLTQT